MQLGGPLGLATLEVLGGREGWMLPTRFGAAGAGAKVKARLVHPREGTHAAGPDRGGLAMGERRGHQGAQVPFPMRRLPKKDTPTILLQPPSP